MDKKSTGLKDMDGNEIFVGDKVAYHVEGWDTWGDIEYGIIHEYTDGDYYIVTADDFAYKIGDVGIMCYNVEKK